MAVCTLEGWGVSRQRRKAAKWMRMAAKAGDGQAAVLLSTLQTPLAANQVGHPANIFLPCRCFPRDMVALLLRDVSSCLLTPLSRGAEQEWDNGRWSGRGGKLDHADGAQGKDASAGRGEGNGRHPRLAQEKATKLSS